MKKYFFAATISLLIMLLYFLYQYITLNDNKLHIIFCNVGQGDGILIRSTEGVDIIVDGGPDEVAMTDCLSRHLPFWDREIEAVFLTHPDADHLTGLIGVVQNYKIDFFGTSQAPKDTEVYKELISNLQNKEIPVRYIFKGDLLRTKDGLQITDFWPTKEFLGQKDNETNDYSLVQLVKYGKFKVLLTGDIPSVYLNSIMPIVGDTDVFKPPHHGSRTGVDEATFQHATTKLAVISSGKHNKYGHPHKEVLAILQKLGIKYLRTDEIGDIEIVTDGEKWWVKN